MTLLPIVARELRVTSRRPSTYWTRVAVAAAVLVGCAWMFLIMRNEPAAEQARVLFGLLTGGALFFAVLSGTRATADCLSEEKREGTLGLLFLTSLRGYDVVLGKLASSSLTTFYGMCAVLPLLALPLLLGSIAPAEFARMALLLVNGMLFSLAAGLLVSSVSRDPRRARGGSLLLLVLICAGLPVLGALLEYHFRRRGMFEWCVLPSPGFTFTAAWDGAYRRNPTPYWISMAFIHAQTWLFFGVACLLTPRVWQDRATRAPRSSPGPGTLDHRRAAPTAFRRRLLDQNPFHWLTARPRTKPVWIWVVLIGVVLLWFAARLEFGRDVFEAGMFVVMALLLNGIVKCWVATESSRRLAEDRKSGAIELLLSTPLTIGEILHGQFLTLVRLFSGPVAALLAAEVLMMGLGLDQIYGHQDDRVWVLVWLSGMAMFVADLAALFLVGLWLGVSARGPAEAAGGALFRILAVPWILYLLILGLVALSDEFRVIPQVQIPEEYIFVGGWFVIGMAVNLVLGLRAWSKLHTGFREMAASRYQVRAGFWRRLLRRPASPGTG